MREFQQYPDQVRDPKAKRRLCMQITIDDLRARASYQQTRDPLLMWAALKTEMIASSFAWRCRLPRSEVSFIVHAPTGKVFVQWLFAVPKECVAQERAGNG